jgi:Rrf2 family cysteine metabolism transcriptional repressor
MKLSIKVQYGLQAVLALAINYESGPLQIKDIAKTHGIPARFLEQLLLILKKGGLLVSHRGMHGGYSLAKHPSEISLLELIELLEGPIELTTRRMNKLAVLFDVMKQVQDHLKEDLQNKTIEDLVIRKRQQDRSFVYNI